jgi:hypothetical protein
LSETNHELHQRLRELALSWVPSESPSRDQLSKLLQGDLRLGVLCDVLSFALPLPLEIKQQLLEQLDVWERVRCLVQALETHPPPDGKTGQGEKFPPDFSAN